MAAQPALSQGFTADDWLGHGGSLPTNPDMRPRA
jgi:hypothetical protein